MFSLHVFLAAAASDTGSGGGLLGLLPLVLIFGVMYFLLLRPQRKRQKETARMQSALAEGDEIVLSSGIHGWISAFVENETYVWVEIAEKVEIRVERSAISSRKSPLSESEIKTDESK